MAMRYPGGLIAPTPVNANYPSGVWTPSQSLPYQQQNVWTKDQYWPYTTLLLQGNGTNGAQNNTFLDSSSNNFSITRNGNTTQGSFTPYKTNGYWSNYFDGNADYLIANATDTSKFAFGTGDFTIEFWVYGTAWNGVTTFYDQRVASTDGTCPTIYYYSSALTVSVGSSNVIIGGSLSLNQWTHIALSRVSGSTKLFVNGVQTGSTYSDSNNYLAPSSNIRIFTNAYGTGNEPGGYCSNFRVVKGTGLYSSTFTPPTAPLTAISGTSLLTCQSNRFIDNSSNAFTVTPYGTPSVQAFQPFPGATTWSASVLGGSGYFDGSGDSLTIADNVALQLGSGDFCIEWWMYPTGAGGNPIMWGEGSGGGGNYFNIHYNISGNGKIQVFIDALSGSAVMESGVLSANTWTHVAVTRSGSTFRLFINGTEVATYSNAGSVNSGPLNIGSSYAGYISDSRTVKGSAVYTSNFTPPTAPLTAITNTSLLLNFTNAGIFDSAMMNDLETAGNAQVSTSIVKYGTGSMAFDGTGDYLLAPSTPNFAFNAGEFTVEMWLYPTASFGSGGVNIVGVNSSGGGLFVGGTNKIAWNLFGTGDLVAFSNFTSSYNNVWTHVAYTRSGSTGRLFINGVLQATGTDSTNYTVTSNFAIGAAYNGNQPYTGYLDDLRITKGAARYISNFTPPVARMPQQ